jgi:hypothetical protein
MRRAIEVMTAVYFASFPGDSAKHNDLLSQIIWEPAPPEGTRFTQAVPDSINRGVLDDSGNQMPIPSFFFVDDAIIIAVYNMMPRALSAVIEAIFAVLGDPNVMLRRCPLAMDKWVGMRVSHQIVYIGLLIDTRRMTVAITDKYKNKVIAIIDRPWHSSPRAFTASELEKLIGSVARLGEAATWIFHLLPHLYASATYALSTNKEFLQKCSPSFRILLDAIRSAKRTDLAKANFAIRRASQRVHRSKRLYFINETMSEEIRFIREALDPSSGIHWSSPIAHLVERDPSGCSWSNSSSLGCFGYSPEFDVWFQIQWPADILLRIGHVGQSRKHALDASVLNFISIVLSYCAVLAAFEEDPHLWGHDPFPVLLAISNDKSASRWVKRFCLTSLPGRALGRLFCSLLMNSPVGINSKWIAQEADDLSSAFSPFDPSNLTDDNFSEFFQTYPQLRASRRFHPSTELLSCLWRTVSTLKSPSLSESRILKRQGLGKLTTSSL